MSRPTRNYNRDHSHNGHSGQSGHNGHAVDESVELVKSLSVLQEKVNSLERINLDLEKRLEQQAKQCIATDKECSEIKRQWAENNRALEGEIEKWRAEFQSQQIISDRLREQLSRTERELYGILQRKYEFMRGAPSGGGASADLPTTDVNADKSAPTSDQRQKRILAGLAGLLGIK